MTNGSEPSRQMSESIEQTLPAASFEEALGALEAVVNQLEEGNLSLSATIETFEQGMKLAERCQRYLDQAELRISQIETESDATFAADNESESDDDPFGLPF